MIYTEKELDQFLHGISMSLLSKKSAQHWRYDEETAREIEWLEALERKVRADKAGLKTEPTAYADGYADGQRDERERWERMADRKTENSSEKPNNSTISKMEQVDKDINVRSKEPKDEPQTSYALSKDSDDHKFNKRMEVEEAWLKSQTDCPWR